VQGLFIGVQICDHATQLFVVNFDARNHNVLVLDLHVQSVDVHLLLIHVALLLIDVLAQ